MENAHWALKKKDHFDFLDHEQAETKLQKTAQNKRWIKMIIKE